MAVYYVSWAWLQLYEACASEHAHGDPKWRPTTNVGTECTIELLLELRENDDVTDMRVIKQG